MKVKTQQLLGKQTTAPVEVIVDGCVVHLGAGVKSASTPSRARRCYKTLDWSIRFTPAAGTLMATGKQYLPRLNSAQEHVHVLVVCQSTNNK
ncbi:hypothetical protein SAMN06265222_11954 [Neorhodopirellula lusitana]|uniref:Uncharacterized protein n=1 Tax=Neorhodopirellula lusitana TaxID=445327 RepID=A0ABY1QMD6_9BACT|nr:hypothetical protein [Neorhodopirellula lusitana]SMP75495.1 hypothetical protein SAMN06265222_11954 [Neorhodopirellula lusitana]